MNKNLEFVLSLADLHNKIMKYVDRQLSLHGITFSEFLVMYRLSLATNMTMRRIDLAEGVNMSASGVTRLLNPMEKLKIVEKEQNPRDARVSFVKLSDVGFNLFQDSMNTLSQTVDALLEDLNIDDLKTCFNVFKKIN
ncbi:MAG: MarR family transcriptional regulator [Sulfurospirillaceae bacterium]|nr:MarR family transcriptional regulator [Sulfurospirillaceae bacterium]